MLVFRDALVGNVVVVRIFRGPAVSSIGVVGVVGTLAALLHSGDVSSFCRTASKRFWVLAVVRWYSSAFGVAGDENTFTMVERPGGDRKMPS